MAVYAKSRCIVGINVCHGQLAIEGMNIDGVSIGGREEPLTVR